MSRAGQSESAGKPEEASSPVLPPPSLPLGFFQADLIVFWLTKEKSSLLVDGVSLGNRMKEGFRAETVVW